MNVNEILQFVDRQVVEHTGKHLDDVQRAVVVGTWQRQTYDDIAQQCNFNKNYVSDVGAKLWQILSSVLTEDIKKSNFCSTIERFILTQSPIFIQNNHQINNGFNICNYPYTANHKGQRNEQELTYQDLSTAPQIFNFYNRESELEILSCWLLKQNSRLISVLGLPGIGKTTLVKKLIGLNYQHFEIIIWRNLTFPKSLDLLISDLLKCCKQQLQETLHEQFQQLIVIDDVQNLFIPGELAGEYRPEYRNYQIFFQAIRETYHQSQIILISQEKCPEMQCLDKELYPFQCLELLGINNREILENMGLKDEDNWLNLIKLYEGNPQYLKDIAALIKDCFDGNVAEFLAENKLIITSQMKRQLKQLFNQLSSVEKQLVLELSKIETPLVRESLKQSLNLSSIEFINGLQSLQERYLVIKTKADKTLFHLSPIFREYVKSLFK
ncbi:MAG: AAA family ATPase [Dolichospermum sp.]